MWISGLDQVFWLATFLANLTLAFVLISRGEYLRFPLFLVSILFVIVEDPSLYWVSQHRTVLFYDECLLLSSLLDSLFQLGLLIEIAYKVLKPDRSSMPGRVLMVFAGIVIIGFSGALMWTLLHISRPTLLTQYFYEYQRVNLVFAFLRLGLFAFITAFSQMLGITWRNHVIRLAAGLAFYSAVSLMVQLTLSHLSSSNHTQYEFEYSLLQHIQVISYTGALAFWVWSFLQKDAPRKEFTPQMERILVTLSKTVHRDRLSLTRSLGHK